jgi:hypothetical protein
VCTTNYNEQAKVQSRLQLCRNNSEMINKQTVHGSGRYRHKAAEKTTEEVLILAISMCVSARIM